MTKYNAASYYILYIWDECAGFCDSVSTIDEADMCRFTNSVLEAV
jgi:hypothetical protein